MHVVSNCSKETKESFKMLVIKSWNHFYLWQTQDLNKELQNINQMSKAHIRALAGYDQNILETAT